MLSDIASARESSSASSTVASLRRPSRAAGSGQSYGSRRASHSHRPSTSYRTDQFGRQVLQQKLENTYRMEPDDKDRFQPGVVEKMLGKCSLSNPYSFHFNLFKGSEKCLPAADSDNFVNILVTNSILAGFNFMSSVT